MKPAPRLMLLLLLLLLLVAVRAEPRAPREGGACFVRRVRCVHFKVNE